MRIKWVWILMILILILFSFGGGVIYWTYKKAQKAADSVLNVSR